MIWLYLSSRYSIHQTDFPSRSFDPGYKILISSFSGIFFLYFLSIILEKLKVIKKLFIYIGQKTLSVLCLHFLGFKISFLILLSFGLYKLKDIPLLTPITNTFLWIPIVLIAISFSILIDHLLRKNCVTKKIFLGE